MLKTSVKKILARSGYRITSIRNAPRQLLDPANLRLLTFDDVVCRYMIEKGPTLNFVQVGAFDGVTRDPLRRFITQFGWRGVLVEPQQGAVEKLRKMYPNDGRIQIVHAAIDDTPGGRTLFTVQSDSAPDWAGGLASFRRETIEKHRRLIPNLDAMIREETVECVSFDDILGRLPGEPDLLQVDVEGADAHILSLFPFHRYRPAIVHWEIKHLSLKEREDCLTRLCSFGYRFAPSGGEDMMAVNF